MSAAGEIVDAASIQPGDEVRVNGEWLDVFRVQPGFGQVYIVTAEGRVFVASVGAPRRVLRAAPLRPTVSA